MYWADPGPAPKPSIANTLHPDERHALVDTRRRYGCARERSSLPARPRLRRHRVAGRSDAAAVKAPAEARHGGFQNVEAVQHTLEQNPVGHTLCSSERQSFPYAPTGGASQIADAAGQPDPARASGAPTGSGVTEQPQFLQRRPLVLVVAENPVQARQPGQRACGSAGVSGI
jgi:hypothetical protein